jgi:hypothetical protein
VSVPTSQAAPAQPSAKTMRRRRQRQKRRSGVVTTVFNNRNSQMAIAKGWSEPYADCRLNPWCGMKSLGIPDDTDAPRIPVDHRFMSTFTFGSTGTFNILALPTFPTCLWANVASADSSFQINGVGPSNLVGNPGYFYSAGVLPEWSSIATVQHNTQGYVDNLVPLYNATKARLVTMAIRVVFTGSTMADSGFLKINREQVSFGASTENNGNFTVEGGQGTNLVYTTEQVMVIPSNINPNFSILQHDGYEDRLKKGAYALLKHNAPKYRWVPVSPYVQYLTGYPNTTVSPIMPLPNAVAGVVNTMGLVLFCDDEWSGLNISVTGGTAGQSFNIEVIACMEYTPATSSPVAQLSTQPPPKPRVVEKVSEVARTLSSAASSTPDVFEKAVALATKAAGVIETTARIGAMFL